MSLWNNLYICNLGDGSWYDPTTAQFTNRDPKCADKCTLLNDALFFKGKLYAINSGWNVFIVDFDGPNYNAQVLTRPMDKHPSIVIRNWSSLAIMRTYLVECSGNLLAVQKIGQFFRDGTKPHRTHCFLLYQFEEHTKKWSRIYGLGGDKSLFLGKNESICVSAAQVQGCRPNCIYFADDFYCLQDKYEFGYRSGVNGVFSCENGSVELFDISHSVSRWVMPAVWCQLKF